MNDVLPRLIDEQAGMVARRQLTHHGVDADRVRDQIAARRWVERTPRVLSTITGELTRDQRAWLAVLHAGPRSMLGGLSAAERHGLTGWQRDTVTVYVDDELSFEAVDGVRFFRSRRPFDLLRDPRPGIPTAGSSRRSSSSRATRPSPDRHTARSRHRSSSGSPRQRGC